MSRYSELSEGSCSEFGNSLGGVEGKTGHRRPTVTVHPAVVEPTIRPASIGSRNLADDDPIVTIEAELHILEGAKVAVIQCATDGHGVVLALQNTVGYQRATG
jgi:hypothetical protein